MSQEDQKAVPKPVDAPALPPADFKLDPRDQQEIVLKNNTAILKTQVAKGGFGEVWVAKPQNLFAIVAERIALGEDPPEALDVEGISSTSPNQAEPEKTQLLEEKQGVTKPITDPEQLRKIYTKAGMLWVEYLRELEQNLEQANAKYRKYIDQIDPDLFTCKQIAVKILRPAKPHGADRDLEEKIDEEAEQRFLQENHMLRVLKHPHIVPRYALIRDPVLGDCLFLKYIDGETLEEHVRRHKMPVSVALRKIKELAEALHHAHGKGILHRDLKPSNILLDENGKAYITDWGIGKWMNQDQGLTLGNIIGTPRYMSPEQATGGKATAKTDVYQLCTLLFEMVTGKPAYGGMDNTTLLTMLKQPDKDHPVLVRELLPTLSKDVEKLIEIGRDKLPDNRWVMEEFLEKVTQIMNAEAYAQKEPGKALTKTEIQQTQVRIQVQQKELAWEQRQLETQVHYVDIEGKIKEACSILENNQLKPKDRYAQAKAVVEKLSAEVLGLHKRYDPLRAEITNLESKIQIESTHYEVEQLLITAKEQYAKQHYPSVGIILESIEQHLQKLPPTDVLHAAHKEIQEAFDPYKMFVKDFNTKRESIAQEVTAVINKQCTAQTPLEETKRQALLEKITFVETSLQAVPEDKIGPDYRTFIADLLKLRGQLAAL